MNFDEEEDDDDEISSSSSQLNSNTRPGSATSKKSCKVNLQRLFPSLAAACYPAFSIQRLLRAGYKLHKPVVSAFIAQPGLCLKLCFSFIEEGTLSKALK